MIEVYIELLNQGLFEAKFAFDGLADEHVWKRPAPGLLSVGEVAGHIAYWEALRLAGDGKETSTIESPLIDRCFRYYTTNLEALPSDQHRAMTAEQVCSELVRVHEAAIAAIKGLNPDLDSVVPGHSSGDPYSPGNTYRQFLEYLVFHIGYHTGQMYSARHMLGESTPDN